MDPHHLLLLAVLLLALVPARASPLPSSLPGNSEPSLVPLVGFLPVSETYLDKLVKMWILIF